MGLFDSLSDMADKFKEDPSGSISKAVSSAASHMNDSYGKNREKIIATGLAKARNFSDSQLDAYERQARSEGNTLRIEIAERERDRRGRY